MNTRPKIAVVMTGENTGIMIARMVAAMRQIDHGKVITLDEHEYTVLQRPSGQIQGVTT